MIRINVSKCLLIYLERYSALIMLKQFYKNKKVIKNA